MDHQSGKKRKTTHSSPIKIKKANIQHTDSDGEATVVDQSEAPQSPAEGPVIQAVEDPNVQGTVESPDETQTSKKKSKGKKKAERKQYRISEEHEDDVLEWLRHTDYLWRKGHRQYRDTKKKQAAWNEKAESLGYATDVLLGWWKHMHSWYGKLHLKKSGKAAVKLTDRENYVMAKCSFLDGEIRHRGGAPLRPLSLEQSTNSQSSSQEPPTLSQESSAEPSTTATLPFVVKVEAPFEEDALLSQMEEQAAMRSQPTPTSTTSSSSRGHWGRLEDQDYSVLREIRDTMKTNTELLSQLVEMEKTSLARKPFITYLSQTLRDMPEDEYQTVKQKMTALLHSSRGSAVSQSSQPFSYQGYEHHEIPHQRQAQVHWVPQMPNTALLPQFQTRQPFLQTNPSSTQESRPSTDNLTGLSQMSTSNLGVLNTPQAPVPSRPCTPRQSTQAQQRQQSPN